MSATTVKSSNNPSTVSREFLAFTLGQEEYGIDMQKVQDLRGYHTVTRIADAPACIKGVIRLNGADVPLLDILIRLNPCANPYDTFGVVVVLNIGGRTIGVMADRVSDVITLAPDQIERTPDANCPTTQGKLGKRTLTLIDTERLMSADEIVALNAS